MIRFWMCMLCLVGPNLMAAGKAERDLLRNNEDLQFIHSWEKDQRLKELAETLALNDAQAEQLRAMRSEVDRIKEGFSERKQALTQEFETAVKAIRQRLEAGGTLEAGDKEQLHSIRKRYGKLKKEEHLNLGLAVLDIGDVLTDEQKQALRQTALRHDGAKARSKRGKSGAGEHHERAREGSRGKREMGRHGRSRGAKQGMRTRGHRGMGPEGVMARILLSDGFLKNLG